MASNETGCPEITINIEEQQVDLDLEIEDKWIAKVTFTSPDHELTIPSRVVQIHNPFSAQQEGEVKWYLESHVVNDPLNLSKAKSAARCLAEYGTTLFHQLGMADQHLPLPDGVRIHIIIRDRDESSTFNKLHWEVLSNQDLWKEYLIQTTFVSRAPGKASLGPPAEICDKETFNILFMVSRPGGSADIGHRLISKPLYKLISDLPKTRQLHLEIIRPGTWKAFVDCLESWKHQGRRVHLVHFDMHGSINSAGSHVMHFNPDEEGHNAEIAATKIAQKLKRYGVSFVATNACESALGNTGKSNFARTLIKAGIRAVMAMSYEFLSGAALQFMVEFYRHFLESGSWNSAHAVARKHLLTNRRREARFGLKLPVDDWIVPVSYLNGCYHRYDIRPILGSLPLEPPYTGTSSASLDSTASLDQNALTGFSMKGDNLMELETELVGRDSDILAIESRILEDWPSKNILVITGSWGAGKTKLLRHMGQWWEDSLLVTKAILISLDDVADTGDVYSVVASSLPGFRTGYDIIQTVRENNYLLIFDDINCFQSENSWLRHRKGTTVTSETELKKFCELLEKLRGGRTIVLLSSRSYPSWLRSIRVAEYKLGSLWPSAAREFAQIVFTINGIQFPDIPCPQGKDLGSFEAVAQLQKTRENHTELEYMEAIMELLDYHPLAMEVVLPQLAIHQTAKQLWDAIINGRIDIGLIPSSKGSKRIHESGQSEIMFLEHIWSITDGFEIEGVIAIGMHWGRLCVENISLLCACMIRHNVFRSSVEAAIRHEKLKAANLFTVSNGIWLPESDFSELIESELKNMPSTKLLTTLLEYQELLGLVCKEEKLAHGGTYRKVNPLLSLAASSTVRITSSRKPKQKKGLGPPLAKDLRRALWVYLSHKGELLWRQESQDSTRKYFLERVNFILAIGWALNDTKEFARSLGSHSEQMFGLMNVLKFACHLALSMGNKYPEIDLLRERVEFILANIKCRTDEGDFNPYDSSDGLSLSNWLVEVELQFRFDNKEIRNASLNQVKKRIKWSLDLANRCEEAFGELTAEVIMERWYANVLDLRIEGLQAKCKEDQEKYLKRVRDHKNQLKMPIESISSNQSRFYVFDGSPYVTPILITKERFAQSGCQLIQKVNVPELSVADSATVDEIFHVVQQDWQALQNARSHELDNWGGDSNLISEAKSSWYDCILKFSRDDDKEDYRRAAIAFGVAASIQGKKEDLTEYLFWALYHDLRCETEQSRVWQLKGLECAKQQLAEEYVKLYEKCLTANWIKQKKLQVKECLGPTIKIELDETDQRLEFYLQRLNEYHLRP